LFLVSFKGWKAGKPGSLEAKRIVNLIAFQHPNFLASLPPNFLASQLLEY